MQNIERELGKLEAEISNLKIRQNQIEIDFKTEVNVLRADFKDLKKEIQTDFKSVKESLQNLEESINESKNKQVATWKTLTVVATILISIFSFIFNSVPLFVK